LTSEGNRVAVLAIDPSSTRTGGSILGDKTRMSELANHPNAYVRPSPSGGFLGGVTANTYEIILLCEMAGYNIVIIETVGVGQSETQIADLADMVAVLVNPGSGDELQGIKKGIMEIADLLVVTKADGDLKKPANVTKMQINHALSLQMPPSEHWTPKVLTASSVSGEHIPEIWHLMKKYKETMKSVNEFEKKREDQRIKWFWKQLHEELIVRLGQFPEVKNAMKDLQQQVKIGEISPRIAAQDILNAVIRTQ